LRPGSYPRAAIARWESQDGERNPRIATIPLAFSKAFSSHHTTARGEVTIEFERNRVRVRVADLEPLPNGAGYEVWLVEQVPASYNSAAISNP
jgi:hypothetical protein